MVAVLQPTSKGSQIIIDRAVVLVGRSADCDVVITCSKKISRKHCCLVQVDDQFYVRDLGSMNGVWLNGQRVSPEAIMNAGDRLSIGDVEYQFHPNVRVESQPDPEQMPVALADASQQTPVRLKDSENLPAVGISAADVVEVVDDVEVVDAVEVVNDVEVVDHVDVITDDVMVVDDVEIIDDDIVVLEDVDVIDDVEVLDDVEVVDEPRRSHSQQDDRIIRLTDDSDDDISFSGRRDTV